MDENVKGWKKKYDNRRYQIAITSDNGSIFEIRIDTTDGRVVSREMLKGGAYVEGVAEDVSPIRSFEELEDLRRERAKDW